MMVCNALRQNASAIKGFGMNDSVTRLAPLDCPQALNAARARCDLPASLDDANRDFTERAPRVNRAT
jgi:hypothetical protein